MKGRGCWEGRAGFGSSCVSVCHEIWLGSSLQSSLRAAHQPGLGSCSAQPGDVLSTALLQPQGPPKCFKHTLSCRIHWGSITFPSLPIFPSLLMIIPAFSMGQLCLCALKPLYFITFAARSCLCDTVAGSHSMFGVCTDPFPPHLPVQEMFLKTSFPKWGVKFPSITMI